MQKLDGARFLRKSRLSWWDLVGVAHQDWGRENKMLARNYTTAPISRQEKEQQQGQKCSNTPQPERVKIYDQLYPIYRDLYPTLKNISTRLSQY